MRSHHPTIALSSFMAAFLMQPACSRDESVRASVAAIGDMIQALASGELVAVNGTYRAASANRSGAWSVGVDGEMTSGRCTADSTLPISGGDLTLDTQNDSIAGFIFQIVSTLMTMDTNAVGP
jgi:hypothetical protein